MHDGMSRERSPLMEATTTSTTEAGLRHVIERGEGNYYVIETRALPSTGVDSGLDQSSRGEASSHHDGNEPGQGFHGLLFVAIQELLCSRTAQELLPHKSCPGRPPSLLSFPMQSEKGGPT